ncbi:ribokinase [Mycobacterium sp.]|uniref:ribokinase n=1 Tax=Mycobacterium sp. TaxID=1785 RepID=UPI002C9E77F8|nr:ribokinase [Mycobacterium sp.]HME50178.1 ribokinase [Mycobacterium sp.]
MARVCVVGSVNMDYTFAVSALPRPGETVLASALATAPGGKGANQAIAAARAGGQVDFVGAVGSDSAGVQLLAHLRANGVGVDGVQVLPGPSGTAVIVVDARAENAIVVAPGANGHLTMDSAAARAVVAECDVLLLQLEIPIETAVAASREARAANATVVVNASPVPDALRASGSSVPDAPGLAELAALADVVVVNQAEAPHWRWPVEHLVVTHGADGAAYRGADGKFTIPAPAVEAVDTTGAGDVFAGVLAAGWRDDRGHALRRACAAGALATLIPGAGDCAPRGEAIEDVLQG